MNPGSDEAIDVGCICPVMDNGHGRRTDGRFVYVVGCPVHPALPLRGSSALRGLPSQVEDVNGGTTKTEV